MAQQKKQYEGGQDSIFNFIFSGARKNVRLQPSRPVPGISGDEIAYALGEIAMSPAIYASEEILTVLAEPSDAVTLFETKMKLDREAIPVKVGVTTKNISEFIADPEDFIDRSFAASHGLRDKANKLNRVRGLGGVLDLGIAAMAARSQGYSAAVAYERGKLLANERLDQEKRDNWALELAASGSAFEAGKARGWDYDTTEKLSKAFGTVLDTSYNKFDYGKEDKATNLVEKKKVEKEQIKKIVGKELQAMQFNLQSEDVDELLTKYFEKRDKYQAKGGVNVVDGEWQLGNLNKEIKKDKKESINFYGDSDEWIKSKNPADKLRALEFEKLQAQINFLPVDDPRRASYQKDLNFLKTWQASNSADRKWSRFAGEAYLNISTLNAYILQGGGLSAVLSGDFFDNKKNNLSPSEMREVKIHAFSPKDIEEEDLKVEIAVPRDDMNRRYATMTSLYYFTPGSVVRTFLVNGEGFVYLAHRRQQKMERMIKGSESLFNYVKNYEDWAQHYGGLAAAHGGNPFSKLLSGVQVEGNQSEVLRTLAEKGNYVETIRILKEQREMLLKQGLDFDDPELVSLLDNLEKNQNKLKNSRILRFYAKLRARFRKFSPKQIVTRAIQGSLKKILGAKWGSRVFRLFTDAGVSLKSFIRRGIKKAVHAITQSLGLAVGGLANALIYVATEVVYFFAEKLLKPALKILMFFVWGLPIFFLFMLVGALSFLNPFNFFSSSDDSFDTAGNAPPISCVQCGEVDIYGILPDDDVDEIERRRDEGDNGAAPGDPSEPDPGSPPPPEYSNVDCPLGSGSINCSQGPYRGFSHGSRNAIDTLPTANAWYAPSDGVITRSIRSYENSRRPGQLCGGIVTFVSTEHNVTHQLVHVVPHVTNGQQVQKGQLVATMAFERDGNIHFSRASGTCTTGPHFHLELMSGTSVYADRYYVEFLNCNLNACPGRPKF